MKTQTKQALVAIYGIGIATLVLILFTTVCAVGKSRNGSKYVRFWLHQ